MLLFLFLVHISDRGLQFSTRSLLGLGLVLSHLLGRNPLKSLESLGQNGMREVVAGVHPVCVHGAQVLDLELDQRSSELLLVAQVACEVISLELELATNNVHSELDDEIHGCECIREEEETNDDGALQDETKVGVQRGVVDEDREEREDVEDMSLAKVRNAHCRCRQRIENRAYLRNAKETSGVAKTPVTKLVSQDSRDFLLLALLDQGIVDDNVLLPGETKEVGVAVCAALAAVDDEQFVERELELLGQAFDIVLELALLERRKLVEQRENGDWVDGNHEDLETSDKDPEVEEELVSSLLNDAEETGQDRRS